MNSCASALNGKVQKNVIVKTKDSNSVVYVNGEEQGSGKNVKSRLARDTYIKQIKIETEGYKDQYAIHYQNKKSPLYIMSWVPFGIFYLVPPLLDYGPKSFNYPKEIVIKEDLIPIATKTKDQKYLVVKNTEFDLDENALKIRKIKHNALKKGKEKKFKDLESNLDKIEFNNSIFTSSLNNTLLKYKYSDSTNTIFKNKTNSAYLSAKISELDIQYVYQSAARRYMRFYQAEVTISWDFLDTYGQTVYTKDYEAKSGQFSVDYNSKPTLLAVEDAIASSFLKFMNDPTVIGHLDKENVATKKTLPNISLPKGNLINDVGSALNGTVTVKVEDGHGSGFMVSNDGYILTNFHVVANEEDNITIITKDKKEYKAELVRQNENLDLALLKVEATFPKHFALPSSKNYNVGDDIFIIGTPTTIELGQTLNKGIISGDREEEGVKLIQTDAGVNGGNSGGPMINKKGELIGVVNAKMSGVGIEGLGFAVPAELIREALSIK